MEDGGNACLENVEPDPEPEDDHRLSDLEEQSNLSMDESVGEDRSTMKTDGRSTAEPSSLNSDDDTDITGLDDSLTEGGAALKTNLEAMSCDGEDSLGPQGATHDLDLSSDSSSDSNSSSSPSTSDLNSTMITDAFSSDVDLDSSQPVSAEVDRFENTLVEPVNELNLTESSEDSVVEESKNLVGIQETECDDNSKILGSDQCVSGDVNLSSDNSAAEDESETFNSIVSPTKSGDEPNNMDHAKEDDTHAVIDSPTGMAEDHSSGILKLPAKVSLVETGEGPLEEEDSIIKSSARVSPEETLKCSHMEEGGSSIAMKSPDRVSPEGKLECSLMEEDGSSNAMKSPDRLSPESKLECSLMEKDGSSNAMKSPDRVSPEGKLECSLVEEDGSSNAMKSPVKVSPERLLECPHKESEGASESFQEAAGDSRPDESSSRSPNAQVLQEVRGNSSEDILLSAFENEVINDSASFSESLKDINRVPEGVKSDSLDVSCSLLNPIPVDLPGDDRGDIRTTEEGDESTCNTSQETVGEDESSEEDSDSEASAGGDEEKENDGNAGGEEGVAVVENEDENNSNDSSDESSESDSDSESEGSDSPAKVNGGFSESMECDDMDAPSRSPAVSPIKKKPIVMSNALNAAWKKAFANTAKKYESPVAPVPSVTITQTVSNAPADVPEISGLTESAETVPSENTSSPVPQSCDSDSRSNNAGASQFYSESQPPKKVVRARTSAVARKQTNRLRKGPMRRRVKQVAASHDSQELSSALSGVQINMANPIPEYSQYLGLQPTVKFKCVRCGIKGFTSMMELKTHQLSCLKNTSPVPEPHQVPSAPGSSTNFRITRKVYLCSACGTYYENWNLFLHMREVHKRHICLFCLGMFSQAEKLSLHLLSKHKVAEGHYSSPEDFKCSYRGSCFLMCCSCEKMFTEDSFTNHSCRRDLVVCNVCGGEGIHIPGCQAVSSASAARNHLKPAAVPHSNKTSRSCVGTPSVESGEVFGSDKYQGKSKGIKSAGKPRQILKVKIPTVPPKKAVTFVSPRIQSPVERTTSPAMSSSMLDCGSPTVNSFTASAPSSYELGGSTMSNLDRTINAVALGLTEEARDWEGRMEAERLRQIEARLIYTDSEAESSSASESDDEGGSLHSASSQDDDIEDEEPDKHIAQDEVEHEDWQESKLFTGDAEEHVVSPLYREPTPQEETADPTQVLPGSSSRSVEAISPALPDEKELDVTQGIVSEDCNPREFGVFNESKSERSVDSDSDKLSLVVDENNAASGDDNLLESTPTELLPIKEIASAVNSPDDVRHRTSDNVSEMPLEQISHTIEQPAETPMDITDNQPPVEHLLQSVGLSEHHVYDHTDKKPDEHSGVHPDHYDDEHPKEHTDKKPDEQPDMCSDEHPDVQPDEHPKVHLNEDSDVHPDEHSDVHPEEHSDVHPEEHSDVHPEEHSDVHLADHSDAHPADHSDAHPADHSDAHPEDHSDVHPEDHSDVHPEDHSDVHPEDHSDVNPEEHSGVHPEEHSDVDLDETLDVHSEGNPDAHCDEHLFNQQAVSGNESMETVAVKLAEGYVLAGEDVPETELSLEKPLNVMKVQEVLKECVRTLCWTCVFCSHAKRIAVNGKQLALHVLSEHRLVPSDGTINDVPARERLVSKLRDAFDSLQSMFFNTDSYDNSDKSNSLPYDRSYECFHCHFYTRLHKELYIHNRKMHQKTILLCIMCKSNFYSYSELLCHLCPGIYIPQGCITFRCCMCDIDDLPSAFRLMVHLRKKHHACDVCLETTDDQQKLSNHVWKHKLHHLCYRCGIAYRNKPDITKHLFWKHGTESVLCKKCLQKKWPHVYHFCIPPAAFVCEECNTTFSRAVSLRVHKRLHSEDYRYQCSECEDKFISKVLLMKHRQRHQAPLPTLRPTNPEVEEKENAPPVREATPVPEETKPEGVHEKERPRSCNIEDLKASSGNTSPLEQKQSKKKKHKKDESPEEEKMKKAVDVFDLPPLNLSSDSDSSDEEVKSKAAGTVASVPVVAELPPPVTPPPNVSLPAEEPERMDVEEPTPVVDGIWDKFQTFQASLEKRPDDPGEFVKKTIMMDHDYCLPTDKVPESGGNQQPEQSSTTAVQGEGNVEDPSHGRESSTPKSSPMKRKKTPKKRERENSGRVSSSSSSDSSSDSDSSSCSCGSNCSCSSSSSSSSGSSSSSSDSDDSSSSEGRRKAAERKERRKEKASEKKEEDSSATAAEPESAAQIETQIHPVVEEPHIDVLEAEPTIRESDLDTTETDTDEDFYDDNPQKLANDLLQEKRNLMLLAAVAPINNGGLSPSQSQSSQPASAAPSEAAPSEATPSEAASVKRRSKKRRKKSALGESYAEQEGAQHLLMLHESVQQQPGEQYQQYQQPSESVNSYPADTPVQSQYLTSYYPTSQMPAPIASSPVVGTTSNSIPKSVSAKGRKQTVSKLRDIALRGGGGSGSETDGRTKRKRMPNRFYGYSSGEEDDNSQHTTSKWRKSNAGTSYQASHSQPPLQPQAPVQPPMPTLTIRRSLVQPPPPAPEPLYEAPPPTSAWSSNIIPANKSDSDSESEQGNASSSSDTDSDDDAMHIAESPTPQHETPRTGENKDNLYCYCQCPYDEVSEMIACDGADCKIEWFHFECVGIMVPPKGQWYCPDCRKRMADGQDYTLN